LRRYAYPAAPSLSSEIAYSGSSYWERDHRPRPRILLAHDACGADPLVGEIRWHADIGHHHLGKVFGRSGKQFVVVACDTDHLDVPGYREERTHSLAHDQVVIREHDANRRLRWHGSTVVSDWEKHMGAATTVCGGHPHRDLWSRHPRPGFLRTPSFA